MKRLNVVGLVLLVTVATSANVHAGLVGGFSGVSDFQANCPLCDSTVSFAVWQRENADWTTDTFFSGIPINDLVGVSGVQDYVYMFQVVNTNQDGGADNVLQNFLVQDPALNHFAGGGYFDAVFDDGAGVGPVLGSNGNLDIFDADLPHNATSGDRPGTAVGNPGESPPNILAGGNLGNPGTSITDLGRPVSTGSGLGATPTLVSNNNPGVNDPTSLITTGFSNLSAFTDGSNGWLFSFGGIGQGDTSSVVFLTSNLAPQSFLAGETESPGGSGASGDLPSPQTAPPIPEPSSWALMGLGVGIALYRRRKKQA